MQAVNEQIAILRARDSEELAQRALEHFLKAYTQSTAGGRQFFTAISGGHTPVIFYKKLAEPNVYSNVDWNKVELFWVDERCVEPTGQDSNFGLASRTFLRQVPIPPNNVHRVSGETEDYRRAAEKYEETIRTTMKIGRGQTPVFDLIILGMGADGHIGSIFPNSYALFDSDELVCTVYRLEGDHSRITLTIPVLKAARDLMILVSGPEKAHTLKKVFTMEPDPVLYPVHALWPVLNRVTWIVDSAAAALL